MTRGGSSAAMSANKKLLERYFASLGDLDFTTVASCMADDVERIEWADGFPMSGVPKRGRANVIKEMEAPRKFQIRPLRMVEENNVVVAEEEVRVPKPEGGFFVGRALGIYELENGKLKRMSSWVAEDKTHP